MQKKTALCYLALDTGDLDRAVALMKDIAPLFGGVKLGLEFYMRFGNEGVRSLMARAPVGTSLFLDLKFHDIPHTVGQAVRMVAQLKPDYMTVHAAGGKRMLETAVEAARENGVRILAVTALTSLNDHDIGIFKGETAQDIVLRLGEQALSAGCSGLVCAGHEIASLRAAFGFAPVLMVPGIRFAGQDVQDQTRVMPPSEAAKAGATHLVVGRAVTMAIDPLAVAHDIISEIQEDRTLS